MVGETGLAACGHLTPSQGETSLIPMLLAIVSTTISTKVSTTKFFQMYKYAQFRIVQSDLYISDFNNMQ